MEGWIKVTAYKADEGADNESVMVQTHLTGIGPLDKLKLVSSFTRALEIDPEELLAMALVVPTLQKGCSTVKLDPNVFGKVAEDD